MSELGVTGDAPPARRQDAMEEITRLARPEILEMASSGPGRTAQREGDVHTRLDANENPYPPFPAGVDALPHNRYPEAQPGHLLDRFADCFGTPRDRMLITRGVDEATDLLVRAFCTAGRDAILVCPPVFGRHAVSARLQSVAIHEVPLRKDAGFELDPERILAVHRSDPGLKVLFLCTPNDPTGNLVRRADVLELSSRLLGKALVVADQTYVEYSGDAPLSREIDAHPNLVVLRTLSKEYSLAGEQVGIAIAHPAVVGILGRIAIPRPLTQSTIATVAAAVSPAGIEYARANIGRVLGERRRVEDALAALPGVRVHPSDANFLLVDVARPEELTHRMREAGIRILDCSAVPGVGDSVRISIGTYRQNQAMLAVLRAHAATAGTPG
ncbi:aminotransferase class I/II-fold pyridoxal phosphate-dependent enzyme [Actinomadura nitritigenes]|uniref:aminotransferase class I/II-fold pyridoxal phosphate-dependent enzyme n=1 Tax=Actinomadura nitritigenes TaxID=134602 RepID=UPI0036C2CD68